MTKTQARTSTLSKEMSAILLTLGLWWVKPFISFSVKQFVRTEEALQKRWPPQGIKKRGATNLSFELNVKGCVGRRWQQPFWAHSSQKKEGCKCTVNEIVHTMRHCKRMSRMKLMEITYFLRRFFNIFQYIVPPLLCTCVVDQLSPILWHKWWGLCFNWPVC